MALIWFIVGYLVGSISGSRIMGRGTNLDHVRVVVAGTGETAPLDGVSSSALFAAAGPGAGLRAGAIDIGKAALATGAAVLASSRGEAAWCALGVSLGHVYPIWHRFRGGFGVAPLIGSLLVLDPAGLGVTLLAGVILGFVAGSAYAMTELWPVFLTPWAIWQDRTTAFSVFVGAATVLFLWRTRAEVPVAWRAWRSDTRPWWERAKDVTKYPDYQAGP